jgi:hypothetical protein
VKGKQPELWCPVSGKTREADGWRSLPDGRTALTLDLPQDGSLFVVFRKPGQPRAAVASAPSTGQLTLDGPWEVSFMPGRGAPAKAVFDSLIGWDKHSDTGIRHFSGTATYRKTFEVSETDSVKPVWLELGSVGALAQVGRHLVAAVPGRKQPPRPIQKLLGPSFGLFVRMFLQEPNVADQMGPTILGFDPKFHANEQLAEK